MAIDLSALPQSGRVLEGKRFLFATPWTELALLRRLEEAGLMPESFPPLGSVGLSAVALALRIGTGPVLIAGIDFSFTVDAYHARSTPGYIGMETMQNRFRSIINAGAAFRDGTFAALSKSGETVRSDPAMRNYRSLFEQEFGMNSRIQDIAGSGLPLGPGTVTPAEACAILNGSGAAARLPPPIQSVSSAAMTKTTGQITGFIQREINTLGTLKAMLTGENPADPERLEELLDTADYLWAHFPECAGAGGRHPPLTDLGFLKRVRAEIDPFLKCWKLTLDGLSGPKAAAIL